MLYADPSTELCGGCPLHLIKYARLSPRDHRRSNRIPPRLGLSRLLAVVLLVYSWAETQPAQAWREVSAAAASRVRGMSRTGATDPRATTQQDDMAKPLVCKKGMCDCNFTEVVESLNLSDQPGRLRPAHRPAERDAIRLSREWQPQEPERSEWQCHELGHRCRSPADRQTPCGWYSADVRYESTTSRLKSVTDALGQIKNHQYAVDNLLAGIGSQNALNSAPKVGFNYDPDSRAS
jgi:hypothetical protein